MKFCSDCFEDTEIKNIINSINNTDTCDVLNKKSEHIYDTDKHDNLTLGCVYTNFRVQNKN